jgi:hypothetical protein
MKHNRIRAVPTVKASAVLVNAGESRSVVASETDVIARALSLLYGVIGEHPGRMTYPQACDVIDWANATAHLSDERTSKDTQE